MGKKRGAEIFAMLNRGCDVPVNPLPV